MAEMQNFDSMMVALPADQWNTVMFAMRRHPMPFETSAPVIFAMERQLSAQVAQQAQRVQSTEAMAEVMRDKPAGDDSSPPAGGDAPAEAESPAAQPSKATETPPAPPPEGAA